VTRLDLRLPAKMLAAWRREAKRRGLSLSAWLRLIATEELERRGAGGG
jgi:hypothetical protein